MAANLQTFDEMQNQFYGKFVTALSFKDAHTAHDLNMFAFLCGMKRTKKVGFAENKLRILQTAEEKCVDDFRHFK